MNPIGKLQTILKEMDSNKNLYVTNSQKDFTRKRKVTFYDMMWFVLFIGANSMSEEIRRAFNEKNFSHISEAAILKSRSKIKSVAFEQLFHKFNATQERPQEYKGYRIIAVDGSDFSSLYSADSEYATISNQYGGANRMHVNFAYDILNKNFLDCVIEAKNKADERKSAVKMLSALSQSPDKELDLDLKFEIRTQSKRLLYKMKIQAWDMDLPCTVSFRLIKVKLKDKWLVLATNLPRKDFSAHKLKKLYEKRWKIELAFRDIKHALGSLHFHSKKDLFNLQEFFAHMISYNLTISPL